MRAAEVLFRVSATTVLVPVAEPEAESLLAGQEPSEIAARARLLRPRVGRVDAVREELHELLFPRWTGARGRAPNPVERIATLFRKRQAAPPSLGYDPFVQIFGRSLPFEGAPGTMVATLNRALAADEAAFQDLVAASLHSFDPRAERIFREAPAPAPPIDLDVAIDAESAAIKTALAEQPPDLARALDAIARLSAWSWPVWRLDGEMLPGLLSTLGIEVVASRATGLFEELAEVRPEIRDFFPRLPDRLPDFARAGSFLTSAEVRLVAGALRLRRGQIAKNVADTDEATAILMRHARLLEEAAGFCESQSLALLEAAGVEWHERSR